MVTANSSANVLVNVTSNVTTLENEIDRHQNLADLMQKFATFSDDERIFSPSVMAAIHQQTANRLRQLRILLSEAETRGEPVR